MAERHSWIVRRISSRSLVWGLGSMVERNECTNARLGLLLPTKREIKL